MNSIYWTGGTMHEKNYEKLKTKSLRNNKFIAVGDIHGNYKELEKFLKVYTNVYSKHTPIFLGDYIDRGEDSKKVIDLLLEFSQNQKTYFLQGNHEGMFMGYMNYRGMDFKYGLYGESFTHPNNGGRETIRSYFDQPLQGLSNEEIQATIGSKHIEFYKNLYHYITSKSFIFVHAGFNLYKWENDSLLKNQNLEDVTWVREDWLNRPHKLEQTVIHGHTRTKQAYHNVEDKQINLDTMLASGHLSCAVIDKENVELIRI